MGSGSHRSKTQDVTEGGTPADVENSRMKVTRTDDRWTVVLGIGEVCDNKLKEVGLLKCHVQGGVVHTGYLLLQCVV